MTYYRRGFYYVPNTGRSVYYEAIETYHDNIFVADIGAANCCNAAGNSLYGINGTFFYMTSQTPSPYNQYDVYRIAINDGLVERARGFTNRMNSVSYGDCGTFVNLISPTPGGTYIFADSLTSFTNYSYLGEYISQSQVKYAIGGVNLHMGQNLSSTQYNDLVVAEADGVHLSITHRSAIFKLNNAYDDIVLLSVFSTNSDLSPITSGLNLYELRVLINNIWGTQIYHGIAVDGGGSTQIVTKENNIRKCIRTGDWQSTPGVYQPRNVYTMICAQI